MRSKKQYDLVKIKKLSKFDDDLNGRLKNEKFARRHILTLKRMELAHEIMLARKNANLTQKEFAQKLCTSQSFVARAENGNQNLTVDILIKMADVLASKQKHPVRFEIIGSVLR